MNLKLFTKIYFLISLVVIIFGTIDFNVGIYLTKPLIMILIMVFYIFQTQSQRNFQDKLMLVAFFFSLLGDTFLMIKRENFFMFGLCSFLITHLFYIYVFSRNKLKMNILARILFLIFSGIMLLILKNNVDKSLLIPIVIYMITITIMAISASERKTNPENFRLVLLGATLFVLSDTLIAIDKFVVPIPFQTFLIMGTYVLAQYLICVGSLKRNTI